MQLHILATGLSGGIGQALELRTKSHPEWRVTRLLRRPSGPADIAFDVTWSEGRIAEALDPVGPVDVLVALAGADILSPPLRNRPYAERLEALYAVDIYGTVKTVRATLPHLVTDGVIILMGWDQAGLGKAGESGELYALAKGALTAYAKSLALTLMDRATVYTVAPGWVDTRWGKSLETPRKQRIAARTRAGRWQTPDEVAQVIEALMTFPRQLSTGQVIYVNRGDVLPS